MKNRGTSRRKTQLADRTWAGEWETGATATQGNAIEIDSHRKSHKHTRETGTHGFLTADRMTLGISTETQP
jgi:hypothetical protein